MNFWNGFLKYSWNLIIWHFHNLNNKIERERTKSPYSVLCLHEKSFSSKKLSTGILLLFPIVLWLLLRGVGGVLMVVIHNKKIRQISILFLSSFKSPVPAEHKRKAPKKAPIYPCGEGKKVLFHIQTV